MSRASRVKLVLRMAARATAPWAAAVTVGCAMEMGAGATYSGIGIGDYPPDTYVATTEPVYYEGHATYWYGGSWYYRDGRGWNHYDREPPALYQRRVQAAPARRNYEPARRQVAAARQPERRMGGQR